MLDHQPTERCDTRCQEAQGEDCNCRCLGRNHGGSGYLNDWYHVGDTTLIRYDGIIRSKYIVNRTCECSDCMFANMATIKFTIDGKSPYFYCRSCASGEAELCDQLVQRNESFNYTLEKI